MTSGTTDLELEAFPEPLRKLLLDLASKPIWVEIGNCLRSIPMQESVDRMSLIGRLKEQTKYDPFTLADNVRILEKEGYIFSRKESPRNYFVTPLFAQALDIISEIKAAIKPVVREYTEKKLVYARS